MIEKGTLSINSENMLPIIKKWLYSDMDIFVRELVSNAADAIQKLKKLSNLGKANININEEFKIKIILNKEAKKIEIIDNGIGMTEEEIKKYINQVAFSGATDFIKKYEGEEGVNDSIIGHFGLGFYSSFIVANTVEIDSLSYIEGSKPCRWICDGGIEYSIHESEKDTRGTKITLHINDDSEFLEDYRLRNVIKKYCEFLPINLYYENVASKSEEETTINNTEPLWLKKANEPTNEEYEKFYTSTFSDFNKPLFWIHLNMDYPFRLKGILYFPKLRDKANILEGQIKLFCNQVYVADNIKEVIPEFLLQLKGIIDCPDLPLNVSRSFLQADDNIKKMSNYIVKKVADKLVSLSKNDRQLYSSYWDDINQFIKYGVIVDPSFYEKTSESILYKTYKGEYLTISEYLDKNKELVSENIDDDKELSSKKIIYTNNSDLQGQYISLFSHQNIDVVCMENRIDMAFMNAVEPLEQGLSFSRCDSDIIDLFKEEGEIDSSKIIQIFESELGNLYEIKAEGFKNHDIPAIIILSESDRRMKDMGALYGFSLPNSQESKLKLSININNELIKKLQNEEIDNELKKDICYHIEDLALINHSGLSPEKMQEFIKRSIKFII